MRENVIVDKSKTFALKSIRAYRELVKAHREYVLSRQFLCSATSIGANVKEAIRGQSKADFSAKMSIALKEASETEYWLELLHESGYLDQETFRSLYPDCQELIRLLHAIVKTATQKPVAKPTNHRQK